MKKLLIFGILFFYTKLECRSQQVIGSTGGEGNVGSMSINYTVGESVISTITNDSTTLTQGFHQPYFVITSIEESFLPGEVNVYPNPTKSILYVQFKDNDLSNLNISIHDLAGRDISNSKVSASIWQTDISRLSDGFYIVTVTDMKNMKRNSYKIFKSN